MAFLWFGKKQGEDLPALNPEEIAPLMRMANQAKEMRFDKRVEVEWVGPPKTVEVEKAVKKRGRPKGSKNQRAK